MGKVEICGVNTSKLPLLKEEEKALLFERIAEGDMNAREELILHNMRLVAHVAKKYQGSEEDVEDLISIGTIGLLKAVATFDFNYGNRFATYAIRCIENAILSQMRLWFRINPPRAKKNTNGVFWHRFPRIFTSFAPLRTAM